MKQLSLRERQQRELKQIRELRRRKNESIRGSTYRSGSDKLSRDDRASLLNNQHGLCAYCDTPITLDSSVGDHFEPYSYRQTGALINFYVCCRECNSLKGCIRFNSLLAARRFINATRAELNLPHAPITPPIIPEEYCPKSGQD